MLNHTVGPFRSVLLYLEAALQDFREAHMEVLRIKTLTFYVPSMCFIIDVCSFF